MHPGKLQNFRHPQYEKKIAEHRPRRELKEFVKALKRGGDVDFYPQRCHGVLEKKHIIRNEAGLALVLLAVVLSKEKEGTWMSWNWNDVVNEVLEMSKGTESQLVLLDLLAGMVTRAREWKKIKLNFWTVF
mmetsp:Transcript_38185/g.74741  ORF Transcript_38185/g.74741 Transcript_38185/m.74741 type:complete len:131 (-) Transcript_38185:154-546(-)